MDIDDDEDGTQRPRRVNDYGIEIDYRLLDDDEREVLLLMTSSSDVLNHPRIHRQRQVHNTMLRSLNSTEKSSAWRLT